MSVLETTADVHRHVTTLQEALNVNVSVASTMFTVTAQTAQVIYKPLVSTVSRLYDKYFLCYIGEMTLPFYMYLSVYDENDCWQSSSRMHYSLTGCS